MRVAATVIAAVFVAFCNPALAQTWVEYRPPGAGFRIELPGQPKVERQVIDTNVGPVPITTAIVEIGTTTVFLVAMNNYTDKQMAGQSADQVLNGVRDGQLKNGTLRTEQRLTMGGHPARRLIFDGKNGMVNVSQFVPVGAQLNQAVFVSKTKGSESGAEARRFIDSFVIIDR